MFRSLYIAGVFVEDSFIVVFIRQNIRTARIKGIIVFISFRYCVLIPVWNILVYMIFVSSPFLKLRSFIAA
ncbi:hypothetical protein ERIC1_1c21290 [Paenibacillus larvae subsp. larvae DSM 25719]|nr:hypothetical protein BXP28_14725 [Paenibacillus larvae subsp. larvae]ETK28660.1 hypothetical protein ERIC1_1c21290 [Paenibacillus larvae subsp. larvae DSM 25719]